MATNPDKVIVDSMDKLHGTTNFANLANYSWNMFRYVGDYLHLFGIIVLLLTIAKNKSVKGISRSTQILYCLVFVTRYLDLMDHAQTTYLVVFKLTYIASSIIILACFHQLDQTYQRVNDTCNLSVIIFPCITASLLLTNEYSLLEILWTFSEFVEGFAMVPQYIFCYREKGARDWGAGLFVICLGSYRVFYALNWIYKKIQMPHYSDIQSWIGGIIEIVFFIDFLNYRFTGNSMLRSFVLQVDTKINEISDKVEMKVLGSSSRFESTEGGEVRRRRRAGDEGDSQPMADV
jgi:ER lumen protein retaining receptor